MLQLRRSWPIVTAITGALVILLFVLAQILTSTNGHLIYTLDDPYIHLTLARNLAQNGTWGINPHEFASAASSPSWPVLLAILIALFGNSDLYPLLLNVALMLVLIVASYRALVQHGLRGLPNLVVLAILFFATPILAQVFTGMEHLLQMLTTLLFVASVTVILVSDTPRAAPAWPAIMYAFLNSATRYEGLFVVAVACVLLFARKQIVSAIAIAVAAVLPIVIFGLIDISNGSYFLPNGIMLKGYTPANAASTSLFAYLERVINHAGNALSLHPHLLWIVITGVLILVCDWFLHPHDRISFTRISWYLYLPACLLHVALAGTGWFYRYDAYLVLWGVLLIACTAPPMLREINLRNPSPRMLLPAVTLAALVVTLYPLGTRAIGAFGETPIAATNIYQQQYQMAQFLREHYSGQAVAINDIGAIGYYSGVKVVDLAGLGSPEVTRYRQTGAFTPERVEQITTARGAVIAIVYDVWFKPSDGFARNWANAGTWKIYNNVVAASDTVTFYALRPDTLADLVANLKAFAPQLPASVDQAGMYTK